MIANDHYIRIEQILLYSLCITAAACNSRAPGTGDSNFDYTLPYRLETPDTVFVLPSELREISGLSMSPDGKSLLALNDEEGVVYYLDPATGAIENTRTFAGKGDFEGIEAVGNDIYAVKSNGTLCRIPESGATETYKTGLSKEQNIEGLCYDASNNRLLLACKGDPGGDGAYRDKKAIYAFDLGTHQLNKTPVFLIDIDEIKRREGAPDSFSEKLQDFFHPGYGPSGLAFNPLDSNLYVRASVGKALAVLHPDASLAYVKRLHSSRFKQPEGICFDSRGNLFISSEGGKRKGRIFRFSVAK